MYDRESQGGFQVIVDVPITLAIHELDDLIDVLWVRLRGGSLSSGWS